MTDDAEVDDPKREFYRNLLNNLYEDWKEIHEDYRETLSMATNFSRFEFRHLDNDGRTTKLAQWIKKGADVFSLERVVGEVRKKYQHLVPDFVEDHLATFEFRWLDLEGGTTRMQMQLMEGNDIFAGWPQEVRTKYGYLRFGRGKDIREMYGDLVTSDLVVENGLATAGHLQPDTHAGTTRIRDSWGKG